MTEEKKIALGIVSAKLRQSEDGDPSGNGNKNGDPSEDCGETDDGNGFSQRGLLEKEWKEISDSIQTDLETFSKKQGDMAGGLLQNLKEVNREKYDYTSFLKKFAVMGEIMKLNPDEFDYVYYTYFTDGYGTFPQKKPSYQTAFVFIEEDYSDVDVPPWAIKLILKKDEV